MFETPKIVLQWQAPLNDGGAAIDHYTVQTFKDLITYSTEEIPANQLSAVVDVEETGVYLIYLRAHNAAGDSHQCQILITVH